MDSSAFSTRDLHFLHPRYAHHIVDTAGDFESKTSGKKKTAVLALEESMGLGGGIGVDSSLFPSQCQ